MICHLQAGHPELAVSSEGRRAGGRDSGLGLKDLEPEAMTA